MGARPDAPPQTARHAGPRHIGPIVHTIKLMQFESSWPTLAPSVTQHRSGRGRALRTHEPR